MPVVFAGDALGPDGLTGPVAVEIDGAHIVSIQPYRGTAPPTLLVPGFVDLQVNGQRDIDVATAEGADWDRLDDLLLAQGVTTWCPTLVTAPLARLDQAMTRVAAAAGRPGPARPHAAGIHLEGPFLGGAPGAHRPEWIVPPDRDWLGRLPATVRIVTLAPEADGALDAVASLASRGIVVSLGHSTATAAEALAAVDAGARMATHVFNGMSPFHHREPGLAGVALADARLTCGLIADLVHVHPVALRLAFLAKPGQVALVTDAVAWDAADHAGSSIRLGHDGAPRLADGTLAGSALTMDRAIRNACRAGVALGDALTAATATPARLLGLDDRGVIAPGQRADLVALGPDLDVAGVWVGGEQAR